MSSTRPTNGCTVTVFQAVDVAAAIKVRPQVACGPVQVICEESRVVACDEEVHYGDTSLSLPDGCDKDCTFWVIQRLCVAIPVHFDAHATCTDKRIACGPASTDPCRHQPRDDESGSGESGSGESGSGESGSGESGSGESGSGESGSPDSSGEADDGTWSGDDE